MAIQTTLISGRRHVQPSWGRAAAAALLAVACLVTGASRAAVASINVQPTRTQVYLGETFVLNVVVNGADFDLPVPDVSAIQGDVRLLGSNSNSRRSISIINGKVSQENVQERVFAFEVKPRAAGTLSTGPVRLAYEGQTYIGQGPGVQVTGIEQQNSVIASVTASRESVLVDEPFAVTLSIAVRALPEAYARFEPLLPNNPPHLDCAYLSQAQIPGLKTPDLTKELQAVVQQDNRAPGFTINDYTARPQDFFANPFTFDANPLQPRPIRFRLAQKTARINGLTYYTYTFALNYTPRQEGDYTFGPMTFKGPIIAGVDANHQPEPRELFAVGPAVTVRVVPPPETNRPDWFIGSVGRSLNAHAGFDATVCNVGDPLTLTLDVTGDLSLGNLRPPLLNLQPDLTTHFRIYDNNVEITVIPNGKRFRYRVRPMREGTIEFPAIRLAYFDTAARDYRTVRTQPIPVQARPTTQIVSDGGDAGSPAARVLHIEIEKTFATPAAITVTQAGAQTDVLLPNPSTTLPLAAGGPVLLLLAWTTRRLWRHRDRFATARRRAHARGRALAALRDIRRQDPTDAAVVAGVVRKYLTERLDVTGASLTGPDARQLLLNSGASPEAANACGDLLARLDQALYRPEEAHNATPALIPDTVALLAQLDLALDHPAAASSQPGEDRA